MEEPSTRNDVIEHDVTILSKSSCYDFIRNNSNNNKIYIKKSMIDR